MKRCMKSWKNVRIAVVMSKDIPLMKRIKINSGICNIDQTYVCTFLFPSFSLLIKDEKFFSKIKEKMQINVGKYKSIEKNIKTFFNYNFLLPDLIKPKLFHCIRYMIIIYMTLSI